MPHYWFRMGTPDDVREALRSGGWGKAKQRIYDEVVRRGWALDEVYFRPDAAEAYVLVHTPHSVDLGDLAEAWDIDDGIELFTVEELRGYGAGEQSQ